MLMCLVRLLPECSIDDMEQKLKHAWQLVVCTAMNLPREAVHNGVYCG